MWAAQHCARLFRCSHWSRRNFGRGQCNWTWFRRCHKNSSVLMYLMKARIKALGLLDECYRVVIDAWKPNYMLSACRTRSWTRSWFVTSINHIARKLTIYEMCDHALPSWLFTCIKQGSNTPGAWVQRRGQHQSLQIKSGIVLRIFIQVKFSQSCHWN